MKSCIFVRAVVGASVAAMLPAAALAQANWTPGSELIGQPIQVTTNGVTNTLYFDDGGQLRIMTPGANAIPGTWSAANGQLCMNVNGVQECVPYTSPLQAGQPLTLASSCGASETWLAANTNTPPPQAAPERGR